MHAADSRHVRRRRPSNRVPKRYERASHSSQLVAPGGLARPPGQAPGRGDHLRRFLQPHHGDGGVAWQVWV
uniref:Uncharacterized protein n=1 Tax=Arundo donax TaxID=35708 RepID=A0A0A9GS13_ARUDO